MNTHPVISVDIKPLLHSQSQEPIVVVLRELPEHSDLLIAFEVVKRVQVTLGSCQEFDEGVARVGVVVMTENEKLDAWTLPESVEAQKAYVQTALHDKIGPSRDISLW